MTRTDIILRVGKEYHTSNTESGEYSYLTEAGSRSVLEKVTGDKVEHSVLDLRFEDGDCVILIETKKKYCKKDEVQLKAYVKEEASLHCGKNIIAILANTEDDKIKVWKSKVEDSCWQKKETVLDTLKHYKSLFKVDCENDRERVLKNTHTLNETLHKREIDEKLRSQFVGTALLYIKNLMSKIGNPKVTEDLVRDLKVSWSRMSPEEIVAGISNTLNTLLDGSDNKEKKIELLQKNVLSDQKVKKLELSEWIAILSEITLDIYRYINTDTSEGQDILNLFFITFNKYVGKADKNQAFTPDHITEFMCQVTDVDRTKRVFDGTCGSGSFLVQAMVKELADCKRGKTDSEAERLRATVKKEHIFGIEIEEKAYGLATTNMLIHGDGNSNIKFGNLFDSENFIRKANPDIILMNPPYNATPRNIPKAYKNGWPADAKEDPTKGLVFVQFVAGVIQKMNFEREQRGESVKKVKMAVLLPVSAAIGSKAIIQGEKKALLSNNTLDAVFTLPDDIFHPGASVTACCMVFTLGRPHCNAEGLPREKTFFGYFKNDGFKKKKALGRVEQFNPDGSSKWKEIEERWLELYRERKTCAGISAVAKVGPIDEWLCEAYMETDYSTLTESDFQQTVNNYLAFLVKEGKVYETD